MIDDKLMMAMRRVWKENGAKAWEPKNPTGASVQKLIDAGFLRRVDMRCGFEALPDAGLAWTGAGRMVMEMMDEKELVSV